MGIKNYLIEGGSGTGKTSVATELERRRYHKVFVLDVDVETLNRRLDGRPNEPGFDPAERRLVLRYHHTREYLPAGIDIDTAGTVPGVVDDILAQLA
ncbi:hypothetical protein [Mesorhizobium salmacidum]|uniref:Adenylyl-sulfate kinase n=1 Tax=Mesorhizobium salmacidum TaxID=3015171 RepID=A0ABU8KWZ9_9HYPH